MKNIRVTYRNGATINTGNFNNVKPEFEISADIEEGETPNEVRDKLVAKVDGWLSAKIAEELSA